MIRSEQMLQTKPDQDAFNRVCIKMGNETSYLTFQDIIDVFGWSAMELLLLLNNGNSNVTNITVTAPIEKLVKAIEDLRTEMMDEGRAIRETIRNN
jgi:hypothetical protein